MSNRITQGMLSGSTLTDISSSLAAMQRSASQLSSGKMIQQPSDNPYGASRAIGLQSELDGLSSYASNVQDGTSWTQTASTSLSSINSVVQRVRELVVQASNGVNNKGDLADIAEEVDQLTATVKDDANAQYAGQYVFSGTLTNTEPYPPGASDAYQGNTGTVARSIAPGASLAINTDISGLLGNGQTPGDGKLLDVLRTVSQDLRSGSTASLNSLSGADLRNLDTNLDSLSTLQAKVGAVTNQLQVAGSRILDLQNTTAQTLSNTQDTDIAATSIKYSNQQAAYQAALRAGANIVQMSLLNFLQ
ncbi:MAG TPA: flagellar hook-associated protein FlgL [Solirubrobacteraceae bacterium]|nr:flagellar hook-associated protein FlgL [Solirubrobacteraceae bacterium]